MSRTQKFLTGKQIVDIEHKPKTLIIKLADGSEFEVSSFAIGWDIESFGLNFKFKKSEVGLFG